MSYDPIRWPPEGGWQHGYLPIEQPDIGGRSEWYLKFNGVDSYGEFAQPIVIPAASDFEFSALCSVGDVTGGQDTIVGGATQGNNEIAVDIQTNGIIRVLCYNGGSLQSILNSSSSVENSIFTVELKIDPAGSVELYVDGILNDTALWSINGSQSFKFVGIRQTLINPISGVVANVSASADGIDLVNCHIDQKGENIQPNLADPANPLTLYNVDQDNDWIEI